MSENFIDSSADNVVINFENGRYMDNFISYHSILIINCFHRLYLWSWVRWLSSTPALRRGGGDPQDKGTSLGVNNDV
jgi:hypothetical protein